MTWKMPTSNEVNTEGEFHERPPQSNLGCVQSDNLVIPGFSVYKQWHQ